VEKREKMEELSIKKILEALPHRYPFLLVDRVVEYEASHSIVVLKNVSIDEPHFLGHFPDNPIMPGVLILESMAQATGLLAYYSNKARGRQESVYYLVGVDKARFKRPVVPGDQLIIEVILEKEMRGIFRFLAKARVEENIVASAQIMTTERLVDT
jgi:3-hydroxyacyl-[acyl-carrier-protein] dehydratase